MNTTRWVVVVVAVSAYASQGFAEDKPKAEKERWKLSAQAGVVYTTGNSRSASASAAANATRDDGKNRVVLDVNGAYVRAVTRIANDRDGSGTLSANEITEESRATTALWNIKGRYDRFFSPRNTFFVNGAVLGNRPAGKVFVASGQAGYSRLLVKDKINELFAEGGYDFTYEQDLAPAPLLFIHSLRFFLGLTVTASSSVNLAASFEVLLNLNPENGPTGRIAPFADTRFNAKLALTTKLNKILSFRFGVTARYDNSPAPLPPLGLPYAPGFVPLAEKLDTVTEATLVASIL